MADSRSSLQAHADLSDSGQISTPETLVKASSRHFDLHRARMLMCQLVLPARDLAQSRFNRPTGSKGRRGADGEYQLSCVDCYAFQSDPVRLLDHALGCPTGRVLRLIDELEQLSVDADEAAVNECLDSIRRAKGGR